MTLQLKILSIKPCRRYRVSSHAWSLLEKNDEMRQRASNGGPNRVSQRPSCWRLCLLLPLVVIFFLFVLSSIGVQLTVQDSARLVKSSVYFPESLRLITNSTKKERSGAFVISDYLNLGRDDVSSCPQPTACPDHGEGGPRGKHRLPAGVAENTSDLYRRRLWGRPDDDLPVASPKNLLTIAAGIKQKDSVNSMVKKFPLDNFTVMIFHYDGVVDQWSDLDWNEEAIHVAAKGQTKWWFAKRFLHPDVIAVYDYIFIWDEDLGTEHFDAARYLEIVREYGLEVSQPGLDDTSDAVHHPYTRRNSGSKEPIHRMSLRLKGRWKCNATSFDPPCAGWVEIMAPVFSREAWSCFWYLIQNDLVHGWGIDLKAGYCAGAPRHETVGVVDEQYVIHRQGLTLFNKPKLEVEMDSECIIDPREEEPWCRVGLERRMFLRRWRNATREDKCWKDPYPNYKGPDSSHGGVKGERRWQELEQKINQRKQRERNEKQGRRD